MTTASPNPDELSAVRRSIAVSAILFGSPATSSVVSTTFLPGITGG